MRVSPSSAGVPEIPRPLPSDDLPSKMLRFTGARAHMTPAAHQPRTETETEFVEKAGIDILQPASFDKLMCWQTAPPMPSVETMTVTLVSSIHRREIQFLGVGVSETDERRRDGSVFLAWASGKLPRAYKQVLSVQISIFQALLPVILSISPGEADPPRVLRRVRI